MDTPIVQLAREHRDATIRCEIKGDPEPKISWDYNGKAIKCKIYKSSCVWG